MAQIIDNINILSTSTITYTLPEDWAEWDYNKRFSVSLKADDDYTKISMYNDHNSIKYFKDDSYARMANNPLIINGMVVSVGSYKALRRYSFGKQNLIYPAPKLVDGVYVEQPPISQVGYEIDPNRANYARALINGSAFDTRYTKIWNSEQGAYLYCEPTVSGAGVQQIYDADRLKGLATLEYSAYPTFAQNLKNMSHGAARVAWGSLFYNFPDSQQTYNLFSGTTFLNGLWLMPFASDDEYTAAYAMLYTWPQYIVDEINNWSRQ